MWPEDVRKREWEGYLSNFPDGEDVLICLKFWMDYLGDEQRHKAIRIRSLKYAFRVLHVRSGANDHTLGNVWRNRIRDFGLRHDPATNEFEIVNMHLWKHALSILRQSDEWHNGRGRLPWRYFIKRIESGCHYNDPIDVNDFPPKSKKIRSPYPYTRNEPKPMYEAPRAFNVDPSEYTPVRNYVFRLTEEM